MLTQNLPIIEKYLEFIEPKQKIEKELLKIFINLKNNNIDPYLKIKILSLLKYLIKRSKKLFGILLVLGWQKKWNKKYSAILDESQNLFEEKIYNLGKVSLDRALEVFHNLKNFDGAILVNRKGQIIASGVYLINLDPTKCLKKLELKGEDLSDAFGFKTKVHTRHITAITASCILKGTTVYTLSEEQQILRVYEKGFIVYSDLLEEQKILYNKYKEMLESPIEAKVH